MTQITSTPPPSSVPRPPARELALGWWLPLVRGIAALLFGIFTLIYPNITLTTLILLFGVYALIDGISAVVAAFGGKSTRSWGWNAVMGFFGIAAGILTLASPGVTGVILLYTIGFWAVATGLLEMVAAYRLRHEIPGAWEWLVALSGLLSVIFGVFLFSNPLAGALSVATVIGLYALAAGLVLIVQALQMRSRKPHA